jgi:hypothetical protein
MSGGFLPSSPSPERPLAPPEVPQPSELTPLQADEQVLEHLQEEEKAEEFLETEEVIVTPPVATTPVASAPAAVVAPPVKKDEALLEVEKILEDGLGDFVTALPEAPKARFLMLGREVAAKIAQMVRGYKVKVRDVVQLIREWLLVIPGVNAFFLEQEAKIKTDRILQFEQHYHDTHPLTP